MRAHRTNFCVLIHVNQLDYRLIHPTTAGTIPARTYPMHIVEYVVAILDGVGARWWSAEFGERGVGARGGGKSHHDEREHCYHR